MKQLSIRFFAPVSSAYSILVHMVHFASGKTNRMATMPQRLVGKWRLYLNYCPECNSCAPKLHKCDVCRADTKTYFSWNEEVGQTWWKRYADKHHFLA